MTLHINTITPTHIISVSDRQISTSRGMLELADDRYKHLLLMTDDGAAIISFAGFAGTITADGQFERSTIDWLTELCSETSRSGKHTIDAHLTDIRDQSKQYIDEFRKKGIKPELLRLAIVALGLCNNQQFTCVIDNCLENYWLWSEKAKETFTTRIRNHSEKDKFRDGYITQVLGDERLALKQRSFLKLLGIYARNNNPRKIFGTSVRIIRAAATLSNGTIGTNCSGIRMTKNEPGIEVYNDRRTDAWELVMPNSITSRTSMSVMVADIKGKKFNP